MKISKNTKKAGLALAGSIVAMLIAKRLKIKDYNPAVLLGGFIGSTIGEELIPEPSLGGTKQLGYIDRTGNLKIIEI